MDWEELLAEFRALGGVAENVRLGTGRLGRGVFVADPNKPARLHAPPNLFVAADDVDVRDGQLVVKAGSRSGEREAAFFNNYERCFGWGAGAFEDVWQSQKEWSELPADVVEVLKTMGSLADPQWRFLPPSLEVCVYQFVRTRYHAYADGCNCLVPVIDLVNHSGNVEGYDTQNGIGVAGTFEDEMLVRYNICDTWADAMTYGFSDANLFAYSLELDMDVSGRQKIAIERNVSAAEFREGIRYPLIKVVDGITRISHLMLGNAIAMDLPRAVFRKLMAANLTSVQADEAFDTLAYFNRGRFLGLLRVLHRHDGPLIRVLDDAAVGQLEALSACIGARPL